MFNYKESKGNILNILQSKTLIQEENKIPLSISEFTFENGIKTWVGALFVDMRDSTTYFQQNKSDIVARVMRAFYSEIIGILEQRDTVREIGIRGDCVYAIYSTPLKSDLNDIFDDAVVINTFNNMFQIILKQNNLPQFSIGIGLGAGYDVIVKAGKKYSGHNDYLWIGDAVINASNLSSLGDSYNDYSIYMDSTFYENIKDFYANTEKKITNSTLLKSKNVEGKIVYYGNIVKTLYDNWINEGMKD